MDSSITRPVRQDSPNAEIRDLDESIRLCHVMVLEYDRRADPDWLVTCQAEQFTIIAQAKLALDDNQRKHEVAADESRRSLLHIIKLQKRQAFLRNATKIDQMRRAAEKLAAELGDRTIVEALNEITGEQNA